MLKYVQRLVRNQMLKHTWRNVDWFHKLKHYNFLMKMYTQHKWESPYSIFRTQKISDFESRVN